MATTKRPEMSAATYRNMAATFAARGNTKMEKFYLSQAKLAYENPLPNPKHQWPWIKVDAFGNTRFDATRAGQRYKDVTGVWNPADKTHPHGISHTPI